MAIDPSTAYAGQIITDDPGWPYGKARNEIIDGDGTGTPLEAEWVADLFGWQQALLDAASITPSGDPDKVGDSQYLDALQALFPAIGRMTTAEADIDALEASRVTGPASATDNAIARYDGTTGKLVQSSGVLIEDDNDITGVKDLTMSGALSGATSIVVTGDITAGDDLVATGDVTAGGGYYYSTPVTRTHRWCASVFNPTRGGDPWTIIRIGGHSRFTSTTVTGELFVDLNSLVPERATIKGIRVLVDPVNDAQPMGGTAARFTFSGTTMSSAFSMGAASSGTALQWMDFGAITLNGAAGAARELNVRAGDVGDIVDALEITWTDGGPSA